MEKKAVEKRSPVWKACLLVGITVLLSALFLLDFNLKVQRTFSAAGWAAPAAAGAQQPRVYAKKVVFYALELTLRTGTVLAAAGGVFLWRWRRNLHRLRESERKSEALTARIPGGVLRYRAGPQDDIDFVSDGLLELFGYSRAQFADAFGGRFSAMILEADRAAALEEIERSAAEGCTAQTEYRIRARDGRTRWLLHRGRLETDSGGLEWYTAVVVDITAQHRTREELRVSEERYRIVLSHSQSVVVDDSLEEGAFFCAPNFAQVLGFEPFGPSVADMLAARAHPLDRDRLLDFYGAMCGGEEKGRMELRLRGGAETYAWFEFMCTALFHEGKPIRVISRLANIDRQKREKERLRERAMRDPLTGLYNKGTVRALADEYLSGPGREKTSALMFIDVDDFKAVNDNFGHPAGDALLMRLTRRLRAVFRSSDLVGRVGGDEFVVLLKDVPDWAVIEEKALAVCNIFHAREGADNCRAAAGGSVGVACYPQDGVCYDELLVKADEALYDAKKDGKNCFRTYAPPMSQSVF